MAGNLDIADIRRMPMFSGLTDGELREIRPYLMREEVRKRQEIFSEGDPPDWFYVVLEGKIKITKLSHDGREIIIEVISPSDFFGGLAVLKGFPYPANAVAMEDSVVMKVSRSSLLKIIDRFPNIMYDMTANLGSRIRDFHETLKNVALEKVESRIASLLLKLADKAGEKAGKGVTIIGMKLTKQDIAEMVGTTVETSIRVMSKFRKAGLISDEGGRIALKDPEALKAVVDPSY